MPTPFVRGDHFKVLSDPLFIPVVLFLATVGGFLLIKERVSAVFASRRR